MTFPGPEALGRGLVIAAGAELGADLAAAQSWERVRVDEALLDGGSPGTGSSPGGGGAETADAGGLREVPDGGGRLDDGRLDDGRLDGGRLDDGRLDGGHPGDSGGLLGETVERLHRAWASRRPVVVELDLSAEVVRSLREPAIVEGPTYLLAPEFTLLAERLQFLLWRNNYDARSGEPVWWWARKAAGLGATTGGQADVVLRDGTEAWVDGGPRQPLDLLGVPIVHGESLELGRLRLQPPPGGATGDGTSLAPDQRAAVEHPRGPVRVVAPAGSGKTRTLNARLLHLVDDRGVEASLVTAVAYNNRAAAEMRERLQRPDLQVRTIHSLGWRIVRDVRPDATLLGEREVRGHLQRILPHTRRAGTDVFGPYIEALADVRISLRSPETVEAERNDVPGFAGIFETYRAGLAERDECDYDEQVYEAIRLLLADPELRARWQGRCRHLLVDEFQDLTPAYVLLLRLLASPALNVFGVGDDDQTIYGYAGADPRFLLEYEQLFPGAGSAALEISYRCPPEVVTAVGKLLVHNLQRLPKTVRSASAAGPATPEAGTPNTDEPGAASPGSPDPGNLPTGTASSGDFRILRVPDEQLAAEAAAQVTAWRTEGVPESDIAVLARVNSMLLPTLAALDEAGIGTRCVLGSTLMQRNLVRAALAWMRLALRPDSMDARDLNEAVRRPGRKINRPAKNLLEGAWDVSLEQLAALGKDLNERHSEAWGGFIADIAASSRVVAGGGDSRTLVDFLMNTVGLGGAAGSLDSGRTRPDRAAHADDLLALRRTAAVYSDPAGFGRQLAALLRGTSEAGEGVTLTSIHRVKGLEWDRVLVFGADETLMPHQLATDIEEERRVLHVAITRGRNQVVVLSDAAQPSRFLDELEGRPPKPRPAVTSQQAATATKRKAAGGPRGAADEEPYDEALFESLRQWRLEEARRQGVPAFIVFGNRTLKGIARSRPTSETQLAAVSGIGPTKLATYGEALLAVIRAHPHLGSGSDDADTTPSLSESDTASPPARDEEPYDEALFESLRQWRLEEASRQGVPAFHVFGNRVLKNIVRRKPITDFDLAAVSGVGPAKMAAYAEAVVAIVRAHRRSGGDPG